MYLGEHHPCYWKVRLLHKEGDWPVQSQDLEVTFYFDSLPLISLITLNILIMCRQLDQHQIEIYNFPPSELDPEVRQRYMSYQLWEKDQILREAEFFTKISILILIYKYTYMK